MMYTDALEVYDEDLNMTYLSSISLVYEARCADLIKTNFSSLTVNPNITNLSFNLGNFQRGIYNVYVSNTTKIPSYQ